jgi:glycosyltransferase involved in cell wall biosynthesis
MDKNQLPKISIVIPTLNQGKFIEQCITSILDQNYRNSEIIIMDGGSTDSTLSIIKKYENQIAFWRSEPDKGQSDAINKGMDRAQGDLVTWLNSDDWYINDALWIVGQSFQKYPNFGIFIGNGFREKKGKLDPFCPRHLAVSESALREGMDYILQPSTFISKKIWSKSGGLRTDIHFGFDWEFFCRIIEENPVITINEFLSVSREYDGTKTSTGKMKRAIELLNIAQSLTSKEITLGSAFYLVETMLQLDNRELSAPVRHSFYQGLLQLQNEMEKQWMAKDAFPVYGDSRNTCDINAPLGINLIEDKNWEIDNPPKISITIPSYNQAEFLEKTILSIIGQKYPNLELFVFDGGSNDASVEIIKKYEEYISFWSSEPDNGPADAINKGFSRSTGEIIGWLNSDDLLARGAIWTIAREFMSHAEVNVVFGNAVYIKENDGLFIADHGNQKTGLYYGKLEPLQNVPYYWRYIHSIPQPTVYFRRELLDKVGSLNLKYKFIFDFEYFWRMRKIAEFTKIERTLAFYRIHSSSKTSSWENFATELYDFSRQQWPSANLSAYREINKEYVNGLFGRKLGGYRRRFLPLKLLINAIIRLRIANPEKIFKVRKNIKAKLVETITPPFEILDRQDLGYSVNITKRKYQLVYCGFFFPRHPGKSGGEIRDFHIIRKLAELGEIDYFALANTDSNIGAEHLSPYIKTIHDPATLNACLSELIDNNKLKIKFSSRVFRWFRSRNLPIIGPKYHEEVSNVAFLNDVYVKKGLHHVLFTNQPDFLIVSPQLNPLPVQIYKPAYNTRIILSSYDVEKIRIERLANAQNKKISKMAMKLESQRAKKFEEESLRIYDGIIAVSELDKENYVNLYGYNPERILVLENSVDTDYFKFRDRIQSDSPEIVFTASLGYFPNDEAAKRLISKIMPIVRNKYVDAKLWIVGQLPSNELISMANNVLDIVTGSVPDVRPYMDRATLTCIPLKTGSGTKYKVLEAAALGVPIVCTGLALEGLNLNGNDHVILGETDLELAEGIMKVISDPLARIGATKKAYDVIRNEYSWNSNLQKLEPWLEKIKLLPIR